MPPDGRHFLKCVTRIDQVAAPSPAGLQCRPVKVTGPLTPGVMRQILAIQPFNLPLALRIGCTKGQRSRHHRVCAARPSQSGSSVADARIGGQQNVQPCRGDICCGLARSIDLANCSICDSKIASAYIRRAWTGTAVSDPVSVIRSEKNKLAGRKRPSATAICRISAFALIRAVSVARLARSAGHIENSPTRRWRGCVSQPGRPHRHQPAHQIGTQNRDACRRRRTYEDAAPNHRAGQRFDQRCHSNGKTGNRKPAGGGRCSTSGEVARRELPAWHSGAAAKVCRASPHRPC